MAEQFTNPPGMFVALEDTIRSFKAVVRRRVRPPAGAAFYMVGAIEEAVAKAEKMAAETSKAA